MFQSCLQEPPSWSPLEPPVDAQDDLSVLWRIAHKVILSSSLPEWTSKVKWDEPIGSTEEILIKLNCTENPAGLGAWGGGGGLGNVCGGAWFRLKMFALNPFLRFCILLWFWPLTACYIMWVGCKNSTEPGSILEQSNQNLWGWGPGMSIFFQGFRIIWMRSQCWDQLPNSVLLKRWCAHCF